MAVRKVEEEIEQLSLLREAPPAEALAALRKALRDRVNLMVAKAAKIAAERRFVELIPDLLRAFDRFFEDAAKRDPQCWGKNAIAAALKDLEHGESAAFLRGARHIQMEPVWGGQEDTAQTLRGICLLALVACVDISRSDVLRCVVDTLVERSQTIRLDAVRALAQMGGDEAALVLRLKAHVGDEEPAVTGQVFDALLALDGAQAIPLLGALLNTNEPTTREEAALALGGSRLPAAIDCLREAWGATRDQQFREVLLRALSASRQEQALDFLLSLVRDGRLRDAEAALAALALHRDSEPVRKQAEAAANSRERELQQRFHQWFGNRPSVS